MRAILDAHSEPGQRGLCRYVQAVFPGLNFRGCLLLILVQFRHGFERCQQIVLSWDRNANPLTTEHQSFVQVVWHHVADLGVMFEESSNGGRSWQMVSCYGNGPRGFLAPF